MSGSSIPYHLRPNKFVERQLFMESLQILTSVLPIPTYKYVSMGGKFLEDFRAMHSHFEIKKLFSIESEPHVWTRQEFNKPFGSIRCLQMDSKDLLASFDESLSRTPDDNFIVWLDYTAAKHLEQLLELESLLRQLNEHDVVKISLCSSLDRLGSSAGKAPEAVLAERFTMCQSELGDYIPKTAEFGPAKMSIEGYCEILVNAVQIAASKALNGTQFFFQQLSTFRYLDGTPMLTVTGIVLREDRATAFLANSKIETWQFFNGSTKSTLIKVPDLSIRERLLIDSSLSCEDPEILVDHLEFDLEKSRSNSIEVLKQYSLHYRRYPSFSRMSL